MLNGFPASSLVMLMATSASAPTLPAWSVMSVGFPAAAAAGAGVAATAGAASPPAAGGGVAPPSAGGLSCANARPDPARASPRAEQTRKRTVRFVIFLLRLTKDPPPTHENRASELTPGGGPGADY